jgi:hypothetical protein
MKLNKFQRERVADTLGHDMTENEVISNAVVAYKGWATDKLRRELKVCEAKFDHAGGRGVEAAEELDAMRIALALRKGPAKRKTAQATLKTRLEALAQSWATEEGTGLYQSVRDMLTDLRHIADDNGWEWETILAGCDAVYDEEADSVEG